MKKRFSLIVNCMAISTLAIAGVSWAAQAQSPAANSPTVKVGPSVAATATAPAPSATAKNQSQKTSIGKDATSAKTSSPSAYWTDLVDLDGDGRTEDTQFLYDAKRGVVYTYREDNFTCVNGSAENGNILMGIYSKDNKLGKPAGSGWYIVALKAGQCGEKKPGTFGCMFDASGIPTTCGSAKVNDKSGELDIVIAEK